MTSLLKLPHVWKTLKEADLAAIRHDAERRFEVLVVAEDAAEGRGLAERLTGADRPHPWLTLATPEDTRDRAAATGLDAAILVSPVEDLSPALSAARDALARAGVPLVTVVQGAPTATAAIVRPGEAGRAVVQVGDEAPAGAGGSGGAAPIPPAPGPARQLPPLRAASSTPSSTRRPAQRHLRPHHRLAEAVPSSTCR
jgi:hypothetical protein